MNINLWLWDRVLRIGSYIKFSMKRITAGWRMIVVGTLLLALLLISDGSNDLRNCNCADVSKECKEQCIVDNVRSARDVNCPYLDTCGSHSNDSYCDDDQPFLGIQVPIYPCSNQPDNNCLYKECCFDAQCPLSNNYTALVAKKADNVTLSWSAFQKTVVKVSITWSQPSPVDGYQLFISMSKSEEYKPFIKYLERCTCLNALVRQYSVAVGQSYNGYIQIKLVSLPIADGSSGIFNDVSTATVIKKVPEGCWDLKGADKTNCPPQIPSVPQNLTVNILQVNRSNVMLQISWLPPAQYNPAIKAYAIWINELPNNLYTNGSTLQYSAIVGIYRSYEVFIYASNSNVPTEDIENCWDVDINCGTEDTIPCRHYCWGDFASFATNYTPIYTSPTTTETSNGKQKTLTAVLSSSAAMLVLFTLIIMLLVCRVYLNKRSNNYIALGEVHSQTPSPITSAKVFIISCPCSSEEDLRLVRNLCHNLADHSIESITYEYSMFESGPGESGIYNWMESNFTECNMMLFVCNKSFYDAWNSNDVERNNPVVSASKQLLQGHLVSNDNISKLAVVLLREHDRQFIPSLYLKNVSTFVVFSDGHCDEENLVRYILQVPRFIKPSVKDAISMAATQVTVLTENTV